VKLARKVLVLIRPPLDDERASQGLRAAVAYAAVGLEVTVALLHDESAAPPKTARHLYTLRALNQRVISVDAAALQALGQQSWHAAVVW
jgi:hypothetical protein